MWMEWWRIVTRPELAHLFPLTVYRSYGAANQARTAIAREASCQDWLFESNCYAYRTRRQALSASIHHAIGEEGRIL